MNLYELAVAKALSGSGGGGGGGASNVVAGDFVMSRDSTMNIEIPYTGSGYPVAFFIFPNHGVAGDNGITSAVARYGMFEYAKVKSDFSTAPTYGTNMGGTENNGGLLYGYKSSSTDPNSAAGIFARDSKFVVKEASSNTEKVATFISDTTLQVVKAGSSYGFIEGGNYAYIVLYSE